MISDPAAFALFWSERLDELCLPAAGLSPLRARAPIGKAIWLAGRDPDERRDGGPPGRAWEGWLALLDFADGQFFNKPTSRSFTILAYPQATIPIHWKAP